MNRRTLLSALLFSSLTPLLSDYRAEGAPPTSDDARLKAASREDNAGWIVLHLSGAPKEIGFQHGSLLAAEIDDVLKALKASIAMEGSAWDKYRAAAIAVFDKKLDAECRAEMEGIVEGLKAHGLPYDFTDILALNAHIEIEGYYFPAVESKTTGILRSGAPMACSAFVAVGKYTRDGKIVMGHNFWWDYLMGQRWRVILNVRPTKGNRFMMDTLPGLIHSGTDFAVNAAGILVTETTIGGFMGFDTDGIPEFVRMRRATQYANSMDEWVQIVSNGNNGGYANTWLLGDTKRGEIGKLELGLKNVVFSRSRDGYYYGANYPEDANLSAQECMPGSADNRSCVGRRKRWGKLLEENIGKIDAEQAKLFLADTFDELTQRPGASVATLCGRGDKPDGSGDASGACNTKVITSDMAARMTLWGRMGFSDGSTFDAKTYLAQHPRATALTPYLHDIPAQNWVEIKSAFDK